MNPGVNPMKFQLVETVAAEQTGRFGSVSLLPLFASDPVTEFSRPVPLVDIVETDPTDQQAV